MKIPSSSHPSIHNVDKIGNLIIYLTDQIWKNYHQQLFLTKLLKLLYIIDETSVKETGVPITGLNYKVWKMGPVAYNIYVDLMKNNSEQLSFYAEAKKCENKNDREVALIKSVNKFDDSEFSDYEIELIDKIIRDYGSLTSETLINHLHKEGTLWDKIVKEKNLEELFETKQTSSYIIDLSDLIANDPIKLENFKNAQESLNL
ncbi:Panacea domain-containing protein [Ohtaekwangia koreensis]|uniref:Uncharacterized phage-associated protein n=1 Tax=Ohtaekwangia koreensis TaxID=688867 RepID=A0A1T5L8D7_9BACT|nr:Panacea domain-containing protein [Ohtaekwangia koreensis]SKC72241.1 Uncharacterized phage-associated protein [Ohtaekwangia koreensis]